MINLPFAGQNAQQAVNDAAIAPVPAGVYDLRLEEMKQKEGHNEQNQPTLQLQPIFVITAGDYAGRKIYENWSVVLPHSPTAENIARARLGSMVVACGQEAIPQDPSIFVGFEMSAKVAVQPGRGQYGPKNVINEFGAKGSLKQAAPASNTAPPPAPQSNTAPPAAPPSAPPAPPAGQTPGTPFGQAPAASQPFNQ